MQAADAVCSLVFWSSSQPRRVFIITLVCAFLLHGLLGSLVKLEVLFVQDDIHVAGVCEFAQLKRGELHLCGAAATEDVHVSYGGGSLQALVDVVGDFGDEQVVSALERMRETSRATLPLPSTATCSASSGQVRG